MEINKYDIKKTINRIIREKGKFPSMQDMVNALEFSPEQVVKAMDSLVEDGYLGNNGSWYNFPSPKEEPLFESSSHTEEIAYTKPGDTIYPIIEPVKRKRGRPFGSTKKKEPIPEQVYSESSKALLSPEGYSSQIKAIRIIMGIIGIGAAIISVFYTSQWSMEILPLPLAILLSLIMVGFSISAFEVMILFYTGEIIESKKNNRIIMSVFGILWLITIAFSGTSIVAGQINKHFKVKEESVQMADTNSQEHWKILQDQKADAKERLNDYRQQIRTYTQILSGLNTAQARKDNKAAWNDINWKLQKIQKSISEISDELENIRVQEKTILQNNKGKDIINKNEGKIDFFGWLGKVLGIRGETIQFITAIMPALFCDAVAPFGLAIALFLRKK